MRIRTFKPGDEPKLRRIFIDAVRGVAQHHYSDRQVEAWAIAAPTDESFAANALDGRVVLVAADTENMPLAFGDVEPDGHIDHIYCRPDVAGTGLTATLYEELESAAQNKGITLLYVDASEPARRFFLRRGFKLVARRDFELNGVPIHNFRMEKQLA